MCLRKSELKMNIINKITMVQIIDMSVTESLTDEEKRECNTKIPINRLDQITYNWDNFEIPDIEVEREIVHIDVEEFDKLWKLDKDYIEPFVFHKKYLNSKKNLLENDNKCRFPPEIGWCPRTKNVSFCNGRNRFANCRDSGCKRIPAIIDTDDKKYFEERNLLIT